MQAQPVQEAHRIVLLDALRGFAVLGILLANIPYMSMADALASADGYHIGGSESWLDYASHGFVYLFADTKFVTIFSMLFGAGLGLMSEKALAAGTPFVATYSRRLVVLFLFGAAHVSLLWLGDILLVYSLIGFVAMLFRKCQPKTLVIWAIVLLSINWLMWIGFMFADLDAMAPTKLGPDGEKLPPAEAIETLRQTYATTCSSGDFMAMAEFRIRQYFGYLKMMVFVFSPRTLALFLLGIAIIKSGFISRFMADRGRLFRWLGIGLGGGLAIQSIALSCADEFSNATCRGVAMGTLYIGGLLMALGYVSLFALWMHVNTLTWLRNRFAAVGRMALTNYLSHSLITAIIFNYCGQFDQWSRPYLLLLVFGIYAFQMWLSPIWLHHYRYGPMEWLWRMATYARGVPIRRTEG